MCRRHDGGSGVEGWWRTGGVFFVICNGKVSEERRKKRVRNRKGKKKRKRKRREE